MRLFCSSVKAAREKKSSPAPSTTGARERTDRLSRSTRSGFPRNSWKASCSATSKAHSPALSGVRKARSNWRRAGRFFLTRSAISLRSSKRNFYDFYKSANSNGSAESTPIAVDVRVIAATNRDLERCGREGLFREDLYHRLNVVAIKLPPLRERREDLPSLTEYFLRKHATATGKIVTSFTDEARERMAALQLAR